MNRLLLLCLTLFSGLVSAQQDTAMVAVDSAVVDTNAVEILPTNRIQHPERISGFLKQLRTLDREKKGKVNIVQIGDSHIQADLSCDAARKMLQQRFGNGGRGFVFPHRLAGTNGASDYKITSNVRWNGYRNINTPNGTPIGLSGNGLTTKAKEFAVELDLKFDQNAFNTIKVITPDNAPLFEVATAKKTIVLESSVPKKITHRIRNGEVLGSIARKYGVTIAEIKRANGMKSDRIRSGRTLKIPTDEMEPKKIHRSEFIPLELQPAPLYHFYHSDTALESIYLLPKDGASQSAINGIIVENDLPGVLFHGIGVNGAKFSDYLKYPAFFDELRALNPDVLVLSLGTNESFDKMSEQDYLIQLASFLEEVRKRLPQAAVIVSTPPPSLFRRKYKNEFAASYARVISESADRYDYAVWDLYELLGGRDGVMRNAARGIIGGDRVHYTHKGYDRQGKLLAEALLQAYDEFNKGAE